MKPTLLEIDAAVGNINDDILDNRDRFFGLLTYSSNGKGDMYVEFIGFTIWDSEQDERQLDAEGVNLESIEACLRREVMSIIDSLSEVNLNGKSIYG